MLGKKRFACSIVLNLFLIALSLIVLLPFLWMLFNSFKSNSEISSVHQTLFALQPTLENYAKLSSRFNFIRYFLNSLMVAVITTAAVTYTSGICGYVLSKYTFRGKQLLFGFIVVTMMLPWPVTIISKYQMFQSWGLMDTYSSLILPALFSSYGVFLLKQGIETIPNSVLEAARIDGAGEFYLYHRIVMPMAVNYLSTISILHFLASWEDYMWPYLMINSDNKQLLSVGLRLFNGQYSDDYAGLYAAIAISVVPAIVVYIIFQKRFVSGVASAAIKG